MSILEMNEEFWGNYGVVFAFQGYVPKWIAVPQNILDWSIDAFWHASHQPPTREVIRRIFCSEINDFFTYNSQKPQFILELSDNLKGTAYPDLDRMLYSELMRNFPIRVLDIPANTLRRGPDSAMVLYRSR